ncbi:porin family protein [Piscinibacter sp.]|jgi:OOP family OmpA-OmpF porin|uniref:porin family protein n=1 Tax=Piscinibacter sp. TaxID=1903157 RepID=UPI002F3E861D
MKFIVKTLAAATALVALSAQAEGLYVGGSIGHTRYKGDDIGGLSTDRSSSGGKLYGGYSFTPNIGVELGWAELGKFKSAAGEVKGNGLFVDAVGTFPFTESLSGLARIGAFNGKLTDTLNGDSRGTNLKAGLGLQYDFNKQAGVRAEWERYKFKGVSEKPSTDMLSVGLNYRF